MNFVQKLEKVIAKNNSLLCVGLDPDPTRQGFSLPYKGESLFEFNKWIIDGTADLVCSYKPNIAFYAAAGTKGLENLKKTIGYIHKRYSDIPVILDAKRSDVGHTSAMYSKEVFDFFEADAVTVNPYLGYDSLKPFFDRKDKGIIILCRTSNPSAKDFTDLKVSNHPLYIKVAKEIVSWYQKHKNLLMLIGATYPKELKIVRQIAKDMFFLIPGIGSQKGDLVNTLKNGLRSDRSGLIISSSRSIIYDQDPRLTTQTLRDEINKHR